MKHEGAVTIGSLIAKVKNGLELLSRIGYTSSVVGHPLAAALGLGAGVASLCIALQGRAGVPWVSERDGSSEIVCYVGGLDNLGNNCFLNVILQALASCSSFLPYLKTIFDSENMLFIDKTEELPLTCALISLLEELNIIRDEKTTLSPKRVMAALSLYTTTFNLTRQQDAAEAFLHLLTSLKREILLGYVPHGSSVYRVTDFASRIYNKDMGYRLELDQWKKINFVPFDGTLRSMLTCLSCSSVLSMDYEHFDCLPIPVLDQNGDTILCIHLQRALMSVTGEFAKHEEHISFPFVLDISPFTKFSSTFRDEYALQQKPLIPNMHLGPHILKIMRGTAVEERGFQKSNIGSTSKMREETSDNEIRGDSKSKDAFVGMKSCMYSLCAVVEHYGEYGSGHYAAYRKAQPVDYHGLNAESSKQAGNSKWFYVSDQRVLEVSEETVVGANATLLFYERI